MKKFLIISTYAPPAIGGGSLMMYNLLRYFPKDSFCILTSHFGIDKQANKTGWLNVKYFFFDTPLLTPVLQREKTFFQKLKVLLKNFPITKFLAQIFLVFYLSINSVRLGKKIIRKEKIEILLGYSDYGPTLFSTYLLHKITKKPFFLCFYDLYYGNKFPLVFRTLAYFLEPKLFKNAEKIFVMCEALQEYYQKKYKREIFVIHNSIPAHFEKPKTDEVIINQFEPYKIIYTGNIYWAQLDAIKNLIRAVEELQSSKVQLYLYTPHDRAYLKRQGIFESKNVIFATGLHQEMPEIQKSADILYVSLAFNTGYPLLINTSSPGKTSEYLVSGKPILVHAPKEYYIAKYAKKHNFALVVDEENIEKLKEAIVELIHNKTLKKKLIFNARQTALLNHDAKKNSKIFQSFFN